MFQKKQKDHCNTVQRRTAANTGTVGVDQVTWPVDQDTLAWEEGDADLQRMEGDGEQVKAVGHLGRRAGDTWGRTSALKQEESVFPFSQNRKWPH